ncbi:YcxB family protein [Parafilimonas sp.]|uniref:YcxB family protein n=1 Tax=Parafilimonas sp. TaxID=1969739 RepID=UPI0039E346FB
MHFNFSYDKKRVLQALRYHFIAQPEIKILFVVILLFDIISGILYFLGKIHPQPFLLGAFIWFFFLVSFWYLMPGFVYKRSPTFRERFTIYFQPAYIALEDDKGRVEWEWSRFMNYFETPYFFHLYFSPKSFFLVPKNGLPIEDVSSVRSLLKDNINKSSG